MKGGVFEVHWKLCHRPGGIVASPPWQRQKHLDWSSSVVPPGRSLQLCLHRLGCRLPPQRIQRTKPNPSIGLDPGVETPPMPLSPPPPPPLILTCCIIFCSQSCGRQSHWGQSSVAACLALEGRKCYKDNWTCQQTLSDLVGVSYWLCCGSDCFFFYLFFFTLGRISREQTEAN